MTTRSFKTDQEAFWAGHFGTDYIGRNDSRELLASNLNFFTQALRRAGRIESCIEFGANIGMNLQALKLILPAMKHTESRSMQMPPYSCRRSWARKTRSADRFSTSYPRRLWISP